MTQTLGQRITIDPVSRIEGHAKITLQLDEAGKVREAHFHVTEFRGFEKFCEGRSFREMPAITSRICGICPVSHLLASAKTGDRLLSVTIPPAATNLRRLMNLGQIVQSHALSFFHLSGPDLFLGWDAPVEERNVFGLIRRQPELARMGIHLRKFGQEVIEILGGKRIHTAWATPGGVSEPLTEAKRQAILDKLPEAESIIGRTLSEYKRLLDRHPEEVRVVGDFPSLFLGLVTPDGKWEHYDGLLRLCDADGDIVVDAIDPDKYADYLGEAVEPWSYLKFPYYKRYGYPNGAYRVGPLARLNVADSFGTPLADLELTEYRQRCGRIVQSSFHYHYARLLEILGALERIRLLLDDPVSLSPKVQAVAELNRSEAVGVSEAPRGTLFHHYRVNDKGLLTYVNLIIATGQNNLPMNRTIRQIAERYLNGHSISDEVLNRIEGGIRAFDPCLSCSTHAYGQMPLTVRLLDATGALLAERSRGGGRPV